METLPVVAVRTTLGPNTVMSGLVSVRGSMFRYLSSLDASE